MNFSRSKIALSLALLGASSFAFAQCATLPGAWSAGSLLTGPEGQPLTANTASAMRSTTCGLSAPTVVPDTVKRYVQDDTPADEIRYRARFFFDPNSVVLPVAATNLKRRLTLFRAQKPGLNVGQPFNSQDLVVLKVERDTAVGPYTLSGFARDDSNTGAAGVGSEYRWAPIALLDAPNVIEFEYSTAVAGGFKIWVNNAVEGSPNASTTGNNLLWVGVDQVRLGNLGTGDAVTAGQAVYFDEFESRRQTFIGN